MPIKPIDIITMPPKSQEVSVYKQHEVQKPMNEQMHLNNQFNNEIRHNGQQATKTIKSENREYRYDAKEKGNNSYNGSGYHGQKKKKEEEAASKDHFHTGSIDIKI
jgi:uncharacterized protein YwqG